jgi:hypothetical protein
MILLDDNFYYRSMRKQIYKICQKYIYPKNQNNNEEDDEDCRTAGTNSSSHPHYSLYYMIVHYDTPFDVCMQRNAERRKQPTNLPSDVGRYCSSSSDNKNCYIKTMMIPTDDTMQRMVNKFETPTCASSSLSSSVSTSRTTCSSNYCYWERTICTLNGSESIPSNVISFEHYLQQHIIHPILTHDPNYCHGTYHPNALVIIPATTTNEHEEDLMNPIADDANTKNNDSNNIHQTIDLSLRRCMHVIASYYPHMAKQCNTIRQEILSTVKTKAVVLVPGERKEHNQKQIQFLFVPESQNQDYSCILDDENNKDREKEQEHDEMNYDIRAIMIYFWQQCRRQIIIWNENHPNKTTFHDDDDDSRMINLMMKEIAKR